MSIYEIKAGDKVLEISYDTDPINPREDSNVGRLVLYHKRYGFPNEINLHFSDFDSLEGALAYVHEQYNPIVILPVYMYEHSGIVIKAEPFSDQWDSGCIGFIFANSQDLVRAGIKSNRNPNYITPILKAEVDTYSKYASGEVYQFVVMSINKCKECGTIHKEVEDSCSGFYEIEDMSEYVPAEFAEKIKNRDY